MQLTIPTHQRNQLVDITDQIHKAIADTQGKAAVIYSPHTTCGITINEGHDPDVAHDIIAKLDHLVPESESYYQHGERNSDSHIKTALVGTSQYIPISHGRLRLGTWQRVFVAEFDGPRQRTIIVEVL